MFENFADESILLVLLRYLVRNSAEAECTQYRRRMVV